MAKGKALQFAGAAAGGALTGAGFRNLTKKSPEQKQFDESYEAFSATFPQLNPEQSKQLHKKV